MWSTDKCCNRNKSYKHASWPQKAKQCITAPAWTPRIGSCPQTKSIPGCRGVEGLRKWGVTAHRLRAPLGTKRSEIDDGCTTLYVLNVLKTTELYTLGGELHSTWTVSQQSWHSYKMQRCRSPWTHSAARPARGVLSPVNLYSRLTSKSLTKEAPSVFIKVACEPAKGLINHCSGKSHISSESYTQGRHTTW